MNSRERVARALKFGCPDRVPVYHQVLPAAAVRGGDALQEILKDYRDDFGWDYMEDLPEEDFPVLYREGQNVDDFGTVWQGEWRGICSIPVGWPIKDLSRYDEYRWPEDFTAGPPDGRFVTGHMCGYDPRWYAKGGWITFFEQLQQLRGMEPLLMDIGRQPKELQRLMDDLLAFNLRWIDQWTALAYDGVHLADDWGSQRGLMINPATWRRLFKPYYAEMFKRVHDAGKDIWFHSDGKVNDIVGDLIEIGADVINVQVRLVGFDWVAHNMRGKVTVRTDIDRQYVMTFGSPVEVREEVQRTLEACGGPQGGIIACGELGIDVPFDNARAMYEAFREYGTYWVDPSPEVI